MQSAVHQAGKEHTRALLCPSCWVIFLKRNASAVGNAACGPLAHACKYPSKVFTHVVVGSGSHRMGQEILAGKHCVRALLKRTCCWLQARRVLTGIRGTADVDTELDDISQASAIAAQVWTRILDSHSIPPAV